MKQVCYLYVYNYKILKNVGIALNPDYSYQMEDGNKLSIKSLQNRVPKGFWGEHICSLSGLIGENGSGKSTILELLFHIYTEGAASDDVNAIVVYKENETLGVFAPKGNDLTASLDGTAIEVSHKRPIVRGMYYTGYYSPCFSYDSPRDVQLAGSFNMSEGYLLIRDFQDYSNVDTLHLSEAIGVHLKAHIAQDNFRISCLLADKEIRAKLRGFNLPRCLIFVPNQSGFEAIRQNRFGKYDDIEIPSEQNWGLSSEQRLLFLFIYYNYLDIIAEGESKNVADNLKLWMSTIRSSQDVLEGFITFINEEVSDSDLNRKLQLVHRFISEIKKASRYSEPYNCYYIDSENCSFDLKQWMQRVYLNKEYLVARYFDVCYSETQDPNRRLSTGELVILKLFSRLYHVLPLIYNRAENINPANLLFIDEAEIGLHPEWQRRFINSLIEFVNLVMEGKKDNVQIILSSHSPLVLSDIPSSCITFLKRVTDRDGDPYAEVVDKEDCSTFGGNLYDLLKDSFFLESAMGSFAQNKLNSISQLYFSKELQKDAYLDKRPEFKFVVDSLADKYLNQSFSYMLERMDEKCGIVSDRERIMQELSRKEDEVARLKSLLNESRQISRD